MKLTDFYVKNPKETALECLNGISRTRADDYSQWVQVGMAIKNSGLSCSDWDTWSRISDKYEPGLCEKKWNSFNGDSHGVTVASLVFWFEQDTGQKFDHKKSGKKPIATKAVKPVVQKSAEADPPIEFLPLIRLSSVKAEPISWQWNNRFPNKGLNLLAGMGEVGKTTVAAYMMSCLTTGRDWIDCPNTTPAGSCLFIGAEDDLACAIRPKLDAAGADADKVVALDYEAFFAQGECFNLSEHIDLLDRTIERLGDCRAVFFDPLNGYLGKINAYSDSESRSVLIPLQNIAKKYDIAIYGLCHLNKKSDLSAVDRVLGSVAFVNTSRAVWFVTWDKEKDIRYLTCEKSNYSINPTNMSFRIDAGAVSWFEGTTDKTASEVLQGGIQKSESTIECQEWLRKKLLSGSEFSKDIGDQAIAMGFSDYALRESKRVLCVQSKKDTFNGKWRLYLPNPVEDVHDTY